jgi:hypothetical protein
MRNFTIHIPAWHFPKFHSMHTASNIGDFEMLCGRSGSMSGDGFSSHCGEGVCGGKSGGRSEEELSAGDFHGGGCFDQGRAGLANLPGNRSDRNLENSRRRPFQSPANVYALQMRGK